jgi:hypothetical protein
MEVEVSIESVSPAITAECIATLSAVVLIE